LHPIVLLRADEQEAAGTVRVVGANR